MPSPLGDKIRVLRKQKKLSLEQLAELTESSKSYMWELENKDDPKPSAEKVARIAATLEVTTEFLMSDSVAPPGEDVIDEAFFRKVQDHDGRDQEKNPKDPDGWDEE